ncbi:potassium channel family protein [Mycoplasma zalophi]|uniref:TrkA family potassium uptake protein n=1 Tax=Mycoplasma zalophi TaxID=191287 RepID=A0ABS6DPU6_9MOLU|nr:TrkA family potassium uptake protein [Mycoplasma zalophi]MBU4690862.1 TrkA family potassium uptake protein [Mycoplasma zalophi]MBU4692345.1 TrkA family potassium uptake protein [Mycoplasma zalophi]
MKKQKKVSEICIIGMGRYGQSVVNNLLKKSADISLTLIDKDEKNLASYKNEVSKIYVADGADPKVLKSLGIIDSDAIVVATGDNVEIVASLQEIGVKNIIGRANSERHARVLRQIGVNQIISPEQEAGIKTAIIVANQSFLRYSQDLEDIGEDFVIGTCYIKNEEIFDKQIKDLDLRKRNANIVLIQRQNTSFLPDGNFRIQKDDLITAIAKVEDLNSVFDWFSEYE